MLHRYCTVIKHFWRVFFPLAFLFVSIACTRSPQTIPSPVAPVVTPAALSLPSLPPLPQVVRPELPLTGVETYAITSQAGLEQVSRLGAYWVRRNLVTWAEVEPQEGDRRWEKLAGLEAELISAAEKHLQVILIVRGAPAWAQSVPGSQCGPVLPAKLPAFASFLHDLAARYSQPPYHVRYWELGNEPDVDPTLIAGDSNFGCWGQAGDPYYGGQFYASMLKLAYPQIKSADAGAQVLIGGLLLDCDPRDPPAERSCDPSNYLEGVLKNGGGDYFDGVSFHAYDYYRGVNQFGNPNWKNSQAAGGPSLVVKARFLRSVLEVYGFPEKYLLNTEAGLLCGRTGEEAQCQEQDFQLSKANYVAIANAAAAAEGLRANLWYSLLGWRGSGLVTADFQPLPAFEAFRFSSRMLNGAAYVRSIDQLPELRGYEFIREGRRFWLLWSADGADHTIQLPATPLEIYAVSGAALDALSSLVVTPAPLYIIFPPGL